jgi:transposase
MYITVEILEKLRKIYPTEKLLIFWDGAGWHRGSEVKKFIEKDKNIESVHFPRYSPEENPQEHVWKSGRANVTHNKFIENIDMATDEFVKYLNETKFKYSLVGFSPVLEW